MPEKLRVLIVEDSEDDAMLLLLHLRHGPWQVTHERVDTAAAMSAALQQRQWDVIIADYSMPSFSGADALKMVREQGIDIPFLLVSGKMGEDTAVDSMRAGADDYLVKGNLARLLPAIERELRDADGRRRARGVERQLRKRDEQLASAQRLARLGTWNRNASTNVVVLSDEALRILGLEPGKAALTFEDILARVHPDDRELFTSPMVTKDRSHISHDCRIICPNGCEKFIHVRGDIVRDADGDVVETMGMIQDITERKLAEQAIYKAQREMLAAADLVETNRILQEQFDRRIVAETSLRQLTETLERRVAERTAAAEAASKAKSEFLANMSHEIRTPLTAIIGFADLQLRPNQSAEERTECIHTVRRNAKHLLELINDILDLSKIEAGKMTVETIDCDLPRLIADILSTMKPRAAEKALGFEVTFARRIPRIIRTDPLRFRQILVNLLGNAIKFTEKGAVGIHVHFVEALSGNFIRVTVSDSGIGLTREQIDRVFQSFTQADESTTRRFGGTGLGLAISRRLARMLGGNIEVSSDPDIGSRFTVSVECGKITDDQIIERLTESDLPASLDPLTGSEILLRGRILLAEDGRDNQRLLLTHLKAAGVDVAIAENGRIAVEMATTLPFDLILMDMQMPEMDGYDATAELRRRGFAVPIVALTAHAMAEDRIKCMASGCTDYLSKPVSQETLLTTVARHLGQSTQPPVLPPHEPDPLPAVAMDGRICSTMMNYPGMKKIVAEFIEGFPAEIAKMQELLTQDDLRPLRRVVHQLRGTGGGYGFDIITELAGNVEDAISAGSKRESIAGQINSLIDVIRRVDGFDDSKMLLPSA